VHNKKGETMPKVGKTKYKTVKAAKKAAKRTGKKLVMTKKKY
tara:strand:- start:4084 stop:4209 length:126 start_codon:yes stop_codon:yes gene_type:complete